MRIENSLRRLAAVLQSAVKYIYGVCMLLVVGVCLFCNHMNYSYKKDMDFSNLVYMILGVAGIGVLFGVIYCLQKKESCRKQEERRQKQEGSCRKQEENHLQQEENRPQQKQSCRKNGNLWMVGLSVLFFVGLVFWTYHYYFKTGWDAQTVEGTASMIARGLYDDAQNLYFSFYPNNVFLVFVYSVVIRLGYMVGITNYYFVIIVFQCFLFAAAGFLVYCAAEKLINGAWAVGIWILYVLLVGMSPWVVVPYSDATGMIFPILIFYLYLLIREGKWVKCNLILLTFTSYVGYSIKPQIMIMMIGIALIAGLEFLQISVRERKAWLRKIILPVAGFILGFAVVTAGVNATGLEIDRERAFGMSHYLMMGLNADVNGVINLEDQNFSMGIVTKAERVPANLEVAAQRARELGFTGLVELGTKKILTTFSDGTFAWWEEGEFYTQEMYEGIYFLRGLLSGFYYEHGENYQSFVNIMQTLWMGVLLLACSSFVYGGRKSGETVLMISIVGLFLFELIFEVRARYLFIYAPVFVMLAGIGSHYLAEKIAARRN